MLKALILAGVVVSEQANVESTFRGNRGHDLIWLRKQYRRYCRGTIPAQQLRDFEVADDWATDLRYSPAVLDEQEARNFLRATGRLLDWMTGRIT